MRCDDVHHNITLSAPATSSSPIPTRSKQTHRDILVNDSDNSSFKVGDQVSLLNEPFTITEKTGPDTYKLFDKNQETMVVHPERLQLFTVSSKHSINTPITTHSVTKNEIFPINEGQEPTEGPDPLPESSDLVEEIYLILDKVIYNKIFQ